jgi:hypothetical protein
MDYLVFRLASEGRSLPLARGSDLGQLFGWFGLKGTCANQGSHPRATEEH